MLCILSVLLLIDQHCRALCLHVCWAKVWWTLMMTLSTDAHYQFMLKLHEPVNTTWPQLHAIQCVWFMHVHFGACCLWLEWQVLLYCWGLRYTCNCTAFSFWKSYLCITHPLFACAHMHAHAHAHTYNIFMCFYNVASWCDESKAAYRTCYLVPRSLCLCQWCHWMLSGSGGSCQISFVFLWTRPGFLTAERSLACYPSSWRKYGL